MLITSFCEKIFLRGNLTLIDWHGKRHRFGDGDGPAVCIALHDAQSEWDFLRSPKLALGELYTQGRLTIEEGTLQQFLTICANNRGSLKRHRFFGLHEMIRPFFRSIFTNNPLKRAARNVAHHYDIDERIYRLFLDEDMQYSCAYFRSPDDSLEQAQLQKKIHIASKLCLDQPDLKVLDVGCGWGGLAIYLAREHDCEVTAITLSKEQYRVACQRAKDAGVADRIDFRLCDYREISGRFDRIVSVEMFEHVGPSNFQIFFRQMQKCMKPDAIFLLHTGGRMGPPSSYNPWIEKYIFPGGYYPALSEVNAAIEKVVFWNNDVENLRLHFADTLSHWRQRFMDNRETAKAIYDEEFCRMWEFYLTASEVSFRDIGSCVYQWQLTLQRDTVPQTRDYQLEAEKKMLAKHSLSTETPSY